MKKIIRNKIAIISCAVLIVSAYFITGVLVFAGKQYNVINTQNLEEAVRTLKTWTPADVFTNAAAAEQWAAHFINSEENILYRITLVGKNGQVLFDTDMDSSVMGNHLDRPEFQDAVKKGTGTALRRSATLGQVQIYAAIAIEDS